MPDLKAWTALYVYKKENALNFMNIWLAAAWLSA